MKKLPNEFFLLAIRALYQEAFGVAAAGREIYEARIRTVDGKLHATIRADLPGSIDTMTLECEVGDQSKFGPAKVPPGQSSGEEGFKA